MTLVFLFSRSVGLTCLFRAAPHFQEIKTEKSNVVVVTFYKISLLTLKFKSFLSGIFSRSSCINKMSNEYFHDENKSLNTAIGVDNVTLSLEKIQVVSPYMWNFPEVGGTMPWVKSINCSNNTDRKVLNMCRHLPEFPVIPDVIIHMYLNIIDKPESKY